MSPSYFSNLFKEQTGKSFIEYMTEFKMKKAGEMIKEGEKISSVAFSLGYEEIKNSRQMFKKPMVST